MNNQTLEAAVAINSVASLFYNYTSADIENLRQRSRDFAHVWDTYVAKCPKKWQGQTHLLLWDLWHGKFGSAKAHIIDYALAKYGDQQRRSLALLHAASAACAQQGATEM